MLGYLLPKCTVTVEELLEKSKPLQLCGQFYSKLCLLELSKGLTEPSMNFSSQNSFQMILC